MTGDWLKRGDKGLTISVRVTPRSSRDELTGVHQSADGHVSLAVKVSAGPDKGKANEATIEVLAKALRLPKSQLKLISGETSRTKLIFITYGTAVEARIASLMDVLTGRERDSGKDH